MAIKSVSKALFAGGSSGLLAGFAPFLLDLFGWIQPVVSHIPVFGPVLGVFVGLVTGLVTYLSPKNTPAT